MANNLRLMSAKRTKVIVNILNVTDRFGGFGDCQL
jgi:hypothetical protein